MKRLLTVILVLVVALLAWTFLVPSPIDSAAWQPPQGPELAGVLAVNTDLRASNWLAPDDVFGGETVAVDGDGRLYAGTADGRIVRVTVGSDGRTAAETCATTGGRPLGLHFDAAGNLIVADAVTGLLEIDPQGHLRTLAREAGGVAFGFTDDLDIASDGTIYFSDASSRWGVGSYNFDLVENRPYGRLLAYHPGSGRTDVLLDGLYFANGVALSQNEDFVLVNETSRYRIRRYWLSGERAGENDVFADNLPGFPDGVAADRKGTFWAAIYTLRNSLLDVLHPRPFLKNLVVKLPEVLRPKPEPWGLVLALDEDGHVVRALHDPGGEKARWITSVQPEEDALYLGTLEGRGIGRWVPSG